MTHKLLTERASRLKIEKPSLKYHMTFYSLYRRDANTGRWERISNNSYSEKLAYRIYAERILCNPLEYRIRPVPVEVPKAQGITHFRSRVLVN